MRRAGPALDGLRYPDDDGLGEGMSASAVLQTRFPRLVGDAARLVVLLSRINFNLSA